MSKLASFARFGRATFAALDQTWSRIWFQDSSTSPLELARIGIGAALLLHYGLATPYLFAFWSDAGWMPRELALEGRDFWSQSVFFYFSAPWQWIAFHGLFLFCCTAFMLGWRTTWVKWIVLVGQISYEVRNPGLFYGVDKILAALLFILCLAPIGHALSLDRVRAVRAAKRGRLKARLPPYKSSWAAPAPTDANPDGGAVLLQRHRKIEATNGGTATPYGSCSPPTSITARFFWTCWRGNIGWSMSRPTAPS
jgi:hypothetical protein